MKKAVKYLGYCFYLFLMCFLLLEIFFRVYLYEEEADMNYWGRGAFQEDIEVGYIHTPNFKARAMRRPEFISHFEINKYGLRQRDMEKQLAFEQRVLFLGDSFTVGLGVEEEEMFTNRISRRLNELGIGVINGGQTGYCITQEYNFARKLLDQHYYNHIFLCLFLSNDIRGDYFQGYKKIDVKHGYRLLKARAFKNEAADYIRTHSYTFMYVKAFIKKKLRKPKGLEPEGFNHNSKLAIQDIIRLCDEQGIGLTIMLIPNFQKEIPHEEEFKNLFEERGIDYFKVAVQRDDYFPIDGHWNRKGHGTASEAILQHISDTGLFNVDHSSFQ